MIYDADTILERMREDRSSDWPRRILTKMAKVDRLTAELTAGELRALEAASHGLSRQMTADAFGVPLETVRSQMRSAILKLRAKNTCHAVAIALRHGDIR